MVHMTQPASRASPKQWAPVDVSTHNLHAHIYTQTGSLLSWESPSLHVTSSRGFERKLPPTTRTRRGCIRARRYTIDVSLATGVAQYLRDYTSYDYSSGAQDFTSSFEPRAEQFEQLVTPWRETDEPVQRRVHFGLPDPLRHRELHRWGRIYPPMDEDTYLTIGNASLTNEDFHTIRSLSGMQCWYRDTVVDAGLELVTLKYDTEANGIAIASSTIAQCVQFAASATSQAELDQLSAYKAMFEDKKWIFVPLNDGIGATSAEALQGNHWALLAINRPHKKAHYIDGLYSRNREWQEIARMFAGAFEVLLSEKYQFFVEDYTPNQFRDNSCNISDGGPCGPYVVKMIAELTRKIRQYQEEGNEASVQLHVDIGMAQGFNFNSMHERMSLMYTLASVKASQVANERANIHDNAVLDFVELRDPAPLLYDCPLLDKDAEAFRATRRHDTLRRAQQQAFLASSQTLSDSSGDITFASTTRGHHQNGYARFQDYEGQNESWMSDSAFSTEVDEDDEVNSDDEPEPAQNDS